MAARKLRTLDTSPKPITKPSKTVLLLFFQCEKVLDDPIG